MDGKSRKVARIFDATDDLADLIVNDAKKLADSLGRGDEATRSQIRRFYQEYVSIRQGIRCAGDKDKAYKDHEIAIKLLLPKIAYAGSRKDVTKLNEDFISWFEDNIKKIKSPEDVDKFGAYFEAFVGYFYAASSSKDSKSEKRDVDAKLNSQGGKG